MSEEKKTVELKDEQLEQVTGGRKVDDIKLEKVVVFGGIYAKKISGATDLAELELAIVRNEEATHDYMKKGDAMALMHYEKETE